MKISVETTVQAPLEKVWNSWVSPNDITQWNFALDAWQCPSANIDLQSGGNFSYRMEAKDGSMGFDFSGTFTKVEPHQLLEFHLGDNRSVQVTFSDTGSGIRVTESFEAEDKNAAEQQRQGWQAILENFKKYVEAC